jgi:tryptophan synthase alpha chain
MSYITNAFKDKAKVAYLTAGHGKYNSADYFIALANAGANVLEIGIPFSDPVADGPVIQLAMESALKNGTDLEQVLAITKEVRKNTDAAIILFTYLNPIYNNVLEFLQKAKASGADGVLIVDLPYEEAAEICSIAKDIGIAIIFVAAPSTSPDRIRLLANNGSGFLYYACRKGTTGLRDSLSDEIIQQIKEVKANSSLPIAVGFGVSNNKMVNELLAVADGCVIGSYFVKAVNDGIAPKELEELAQKIFSTHDVK